MMIRRDQIEVQGEGLDHPECVAIDAAGTIYAGGEAGQIYRLGRDGSQQQMAAIGGFLLGIALDGEGRIHSCDCARRTVWLIDRDGRARPRSTGAPDHPFTVPNFPVFDRGGNLYVSDSGDYWNPTGDGMAIDSTGEWLYVVQSTAASVVRIPLHEPHGPIEVTHQLPSGIVPDGIAATADGRVVIGWYKRTESSSAIRTGESNSCAKTRLASCSAGRPTWRWRTADFTSRILAVGISRRWQLT